MPRACHRNTQSTEDAYGQVGNLGQNLLTWTHTGLEIIEGRTPAPIKTADPEIAPESPLAQVPWGLGTEVLKALTHLIAKDLQERAEVHLFPD